MTKINKLLSVSLAVIIIIACCIFGFMANEKVFSDVIEDQGLITNLEDYYYKNEFNNFLEDIGKKRVDIEKVNNTIIYDFSERPSFILTYSNSFGYMISNRETGTSLERIGIGNSPYTDVISEKCYYMGVGNYYYHKNQEVLDIFTGNSISSEWKNELQSCINQLKELDIKENGYLNIYSRTSTSDRLNNSKYISAEGEKYFNRPWDTYISLDGKIFNHDMFFPQNDGDSCAIVAAIQLLQYLDRLGIVDTTSIFRQVNSGKIVETGSGGYFVNNCLSQCMHNELDSMTWSGAFGENYTNNVIIGLKKFFEKYSPRMQVQIQTPDGLVNQNRTCNAIFSFKDNACYDNMKGQIDSGKPAIGMTSIGNGYYLNQNGNWSMDDVARHMMIVYGYCTTDNGTLKDFITHSGWRKSNKQ